MADEIGLDDEFLNSVQFGSTGFQPAPQPTNVEAQPVKRGVTDDPAISTGEVEDLGVGDYAADLAGGVGNGVVGFGQSLLSLVDAGAEGLGTDFVDDKILETKVFGETKSLVGGLAEGITQFAVGFVPVLGVVSKLGKAGKLGRVLAGGTKTSKILQGASAGAVADFFAFQAHEQRLSNLIQEFPMLDNPITEFLAAKDTDTEIEGRLKNVVEGLLLGGAFESAFLVAARAYRSGRRIISGGGSNEEATEAVVKQLAKDEDSEKLLRLTVQDELDDINTRPAGAPGHAADQARAVEEDALTPAVAAATKIASTAPRALIDETAAAGVVRRLKTAQESGHPVELIDVYDPTFSNYGKMETAPDVLSAIKSVDDLIKPVRSALRQGVTPLEEIKRGAADILGDEREVDRLLADLPRIADDLDGIASRVTAADALALDLAGHLDNQIKALHLDNLGPKDLANVMRTLTRIADLRETTREIIAQGARLTSSRRINPFEGKLSDEAIDFLISQAGGSKRVQELVGRAALVNGRPARAGQLVKAGFDRKWNRIIGIHNEFWINSILSGAKTFAVNVMGPVLKTALLPLERFVGGTIDRIVTGDATAQRHAIQYSLALPRAFGDGLRFAWESLLSGTNRLDPYGKVIDNTVGVPVAIGNAQSTTSIPELLSRTGGALKDIKNIDRRTVFQLSLDWLGNTVRLPTRFIGAQDEFFKQINYRAEVYAQAYENALRKFGKDGDMGRVALEAEKVVKESFNKFGKGTNEAGLAVARSSTFTDTLQGKMGKWLQEGVNEMPLMRVAIPFVRTPLNILDDTIVRTPILQFAKRSFREALKPGADPLVRADAYGRIATGMAMTSFGVWMGSSGLLTGRGPANTSQRKTLQDTGWQRYSFRVGEEFVSFERIEPFGSILGVWADMATAMQWANDPLVESEIDPTEWEEVLLASAMSIANNITNKTYLRGLAEVMSFAQDPDAGVRRKILQRRIASYIPNGLAQPVVGGDEIMRETQGVMDALASRIPWMSPDLSPKRNLFGEVVKYPEALGPNSASPIKMSKLVDDDVKNELARLKEGFSVPPPKIGDKDSVEIDLRDFERTLKDGTEQDAYDRFQELHGTLKVSGRTMHEALTEVIRSPEYKAAGGPNFTNQQVKIIRAVIGKFREDAFEQTQSEYPKLQREILRGQLTREIGPDEADKTLKQLDEI